MVAHSRSPSSALALTAEQLLQLPDDDSRRELVAGQLREMTPAGAEHGAVAARILTLLDRAAGDANAGRVFAAETGFLLERDPDTVRAPDAAFVTRERVEKAGPVPGFWPGPPDLAVEVVSPGDTYSQLHEKARAWLRAGARLVLVADPVNRDVTLYRTPAEAIVLTGDEPVDCSTVLPGFTPPARSLFP